MPKKLGGFDCAIRIPAGGDDGGLKANVEGLRYHLAPYVFHTRSVLSVAILISSRFKKGNRGGAVLRLLLGPMVTWCLDPLDVRSFQGAFSLNTPSFALIALTALTKVVLKGSTLNLDSIRTGGDLGDLVSRLLEKVSPRELVEPNPIYLELLVTQVPERRIKARSVSQHSFLGPRFPIQNLDPNPRSGERRDEVAGSALRRMHEFDRGNRKIAPTRKPFGDLVNPRHPLSHLKGNSDRANHQGYSSDVVFAAGLSTSIQPPLRTRQASRRVVSDPVYGTKERRKFLDPIEEVENEPENEERPTPGLRVRFRSKSVNVVVPKFLQAGSNAPTTGDSESHIQVEGSLLERSVGSLEVVSKGEMIKGMEDEMNTEELLRDFEEAFHSPLSSSILKRTVPNEPARQIKSILDAVVPESHSTPPAVKPNPRPVSSPPTLLPPSEPLYHPFDDPPSKGIGAPRPKLFNTSFLPPQAHKVARGQLVILPSRTLLVDFREGERRQGRQGVEVFTVSPNGEEVQCPPYVLVVYTV